MDTTGTTARQRVSQEFVSTARRRISEMRTEAAQVTATIGLRDDQADIVLRALFGSAAYSPDAGSARDEEV